MPILWWSRGGKIVSFVGGATLVLDLVGPDRLRELGRAPTRHWGRITEMRNSTTLVLGIVGAVLPMAALVPTFLTGSLIGLAILAVVMVGTLLAFGFVAAVHFGPPLLIRLLDTDKPAQVLRYVGAVMLLVGFHFDLLAS